MLDTTVAIFPKNSREQVRVTVGDFRGRLILNIRVYWTSDGTNWSPSKKGLAIGVEKLPVLLASLHQAAEVVGQDMPEDVEDDEALLTPAEKATLCDELNLDIEEIDKSLTG
jgi:hypothetical protein